MAQKTAKAIVKSHEPCGRNVEIRAEIEQRIVESRQTIGVGKAVINRPIDYMAPLRIYERP